MPKYEFEEFSKVIDLGENFDQKKWLNGFSADGWLIISYGMLGHQLGVHDRGALRGKPIMGSRAVVACQREVHESQEALA